MLPGVYQSIGKWLSFVLFFLYLVDQRRNFHKIRSCSCYYGKVFHYCFSWDSNCLSFPFKVRFKLSFLTNSYVKPRSKYSSNLEDIKFIRFFVNSVWLEYSIMNLLVCV